ncbi:MAG: FecCD family ABC transporter permease [Caulobacteraceae bacterium]
MERVLEAPTAPSRVRPAGQWGFLVLLAITLFVALALAVVFGETSLTARQYLEAFARPESASGEILWLIRSPRAVAAALTGAELGLSGAVMQGLLRNPLADPAVLGVSAVSALGAAVVIALGLSAAAGSIEAAALFGALACGALVVFLAARFSEPEMLILFGVAISAVGAAATALVFNLSSSLVTTAEILSWLLGSVANRDWSDVALSLIPALAGAALCAFSARGIRMLTLGEETASVSGLPMARLRAFAVAGAALLTGASVAMAGVIGFVGLAAPHLVRWRVRDDPAATLAPSALAGAVLVLLADLAARLIPTEEELRLGVVTALFGAPLFALVAWRAARSWRA